MCSAMPASSPPVRVTSQPAISPNANRSKNSGEFWVPCASAKSVAVTTIATHLLPEKRAEGLQQVAPEEVLLPGRLQRGREQHHRGADGGGP